MPLTLAWHCSKLEKPQLSVPPRPEYSAHHDALAGVCVSTAGIITSAATITLALKRIASLLMLMENNLISTRQVRYWPMVQRLKEAQREPRELREQTRVSPDFRLGTRADSRVTRSD